ncbi:MAG: YfcE family phosphodiesterase [Epsilonproteobacteria bacterium]|nr:MAG: YfcE family phosphodiesterase [Campylobacterota bacterium]
MKIAIVSDSHRKQNLTKEAIDMLKAKGATYLVHAGDLEIIENLDILKNSGLTYVSVFGNNDYNLVQYAKNYNIYQEPYYFKIKDLKFKLMHIPTYMTPDSDIIIFGHTHIFEHQYTNNTLFLNPGELCAREKDLTQCVLLTITEDKYIIEYNFKKPNDKVWKNKIYEYTK